MATVFPKDIALLPATPPPLSPPLHPPSIPPTALIWVLPDPLYTQAPQLYSNLTRGIQSKFGLTSPERLVLLGVLKHMPLGSSSNRCAAVTTLIDRILSLDPPDIKVLAEIFTNGLLDARSWGGTCKTVCSRAISRESAKNSVPNSVESRIESPVLDTKYSNIFQRLDISPFPHDRVSIDGDKPPRRTAKHSRACLERQNSRCPLTTQSDIGLETVHLIPHSVAALKNSETPFWLLVAICLGPDLRDRLYSIIRGADSYSTTNGLVLGCMMHKFFDKGIFYLIPAPEPDFDTQTSHHLDVTFQWKFSPDNLGLCVTRLPPRPDDQTHTTSAGSTVQVLAPQVRQIQDGDVFRLFTDDPAHLPLPHPFLLSLHGVLWEMIGSAGLGETSQEKRKRLQRPAKNGDSDDSYDDAGRKRTKRGTRRVRKTKDTPRLSGQQPPPPAGGEGPSTQEAGNQVTASLVVSAQDRLPPSGRTTPVAGGMTFLQREYLDFKLRQALAGELDFSIEENDSDSDEDDSSRTTSYHDRTPSAYRVAWRDIASSSSGDYSSDHDASLGNKEEEPDHRNRKGEVDGVCREFADVPCKKLGE